MFFLCFPPICFILPHKRLIRILHVTPVTPPHPSFPSLSPLCFLAVLCRQHRLPVAGSWYTTSNNGSIRRTSSLDALTAPYLSGHWPPGLQPRPLCPLHEGQIHPGELHQCTQDVITQFRNTLHILRNQPFTFSLKTFHSNLSDIK